MLLFRVDFMLRSCRPREMHFWNISMNMDYLPLLFTVSHI